MQIVFKTTFVSLVLSFFRKRAEYVWQLFLDFQRVEISFQDLAEQLWNNIPRQENCLRISLLDYPPRF